MTHQNQRAARRNGALVTTFVLVALVAGGCTIPDDADRTGTRDVFGIGVVWSDWLSPDELPAAYRDSPRSYDQAQLALIADAGGTATHGTFDWAGLEPSPGVWDWTRADERTADAVAEGLTIYAYLGNTPDWALPEVADGEDPIPGWCTPPAEEYAGAFMAYCRAVAERYRGRVDHFFFWNEPNGCSWVNGNCSNSDGYELYTRWLKRAYTAIKEGNPDAVLAAGSLDYHAGVPNGYQYLEGMYASGAKGYFDAFDIHPYAEDGLHWEAVDDIRRVLDAHGDGDVPVWISEWGWSDSSAADAPDRATAVLERLLAPEYAYVTYARYLVLSDLPGGESFGLVARDLSPRPIFAAFEAVSSR